MPVDSLKENLATDLLWEFRSPFRSPIDFLSLSTPLPSEVQEFIETYVGVRPIDLRAERTHVLFNCAVQKALQSAIAFKMNLCSQKVEILRKQENTPLPIEENRGPLFWAILSRTYGFFTWRAPLKGELESDLNQAKTEIDCLLRWQREPIELLRPLQSKITFIHNTLIGR
jgi:hypothetical protein